MVNLKKIKYSRIFTIIYNGLWMRLSTFFILAKVYWSSQGKELKSCGIKRCVSLRRGQLDFSGGTVNKNPPANAEDMGSIPSLGRFHMPWAAKTFVPQLLSSRARQPQLMSLCAEALES